MKSGVFPRFSVTLEFSLSLFSSHVHTQHMHLYNHTCLCVCTCKYISDITIEIPGYKNMVSSVHNFFLVSTYIAFIHSLLHACTQTPAERVKAKLKLMLEKTSSKEGQTQSQMPSTSTITVPDAADLASIESDNFKPADFVSHRTTVVQQQVRL